MISETSAPNLKKLLSRIQVLNKQRRIKICRESVTNFCAVLLKSLDQAGPAVSIVFVSARQMHLMNYRYLQRNYATDVLSFSYKRVIVEGMPFLGEIIIAPEVAVRQAFRYRVNPEKELRKLLLHGMLHLLGYDHETDGGRMNRIQTKLMRRVFFMDSPPLANLKANR